MSEACNKLFPEHQKLSAGLFLITCCCKNKRMYGFKKMVTGESPIILFDVIMTWFEEDYNPTIIYDASCLEKEVEMDREPE